MVEEGWKEAIVGAKTLKAGMPGKCWMRLGNGAESRARLGKERLPGPC